MSEFTAPSLEEIQEKFPQHQIESFIAQGGMGAVYLATQRSLDRPVAIKILPKEFGEDEDYRISFETEAKAMAKLNHSNLVGIYDFGDLDGMLYIIMEYIPGRSLHDTAHGQCVDQMEAARLIADMCYGLDHAHSAGMLHRDIKPANVLIDDEAKPKIVDFGLARPLGEEQSDGVVFGTPGYTAPEVITNPFAVDQRSDIFSMGVMLYEMLTGHLPGEPVVPASRVTQSDVRFDAILAKAIHPDPLQRYDTAGVMADALEDLIKKVGEGSGLVTSGALVGHTSAIRSRSLGGGVRPVALKSSSGGSGGTVVVLIAVLLIGGILFVTMSGPSDEEKSSRFQREAQERAENDERLMKEAEKVMADESRAAEREKDVEKKRESEEQSEAKDRREAKKKRKAEKKEEREGEGREAEEKREARRKLKSEEKNRESKKSGNKGSIDEIILPFDD